MRPVIENLVLALLDLGGALLVLSLSHASDIVRTVVPLWMVALAIFHVSLAAGHWRRGY